MGSRSKLINCINQFGKVHLGTNPRCTTPFHFESSANFEELQVQSNYGKAMRAKSIVVIKVKYIKQASLTAPSAPVDRCVGHFAKEAGT
ncbi:MAG: hypothetical protein ABI671_08660 [Burkholderiales bacterium]